MNEKRIRCLQTGNPGTGPIVYWMSRDQRAHDNYGLLHAFEIAEQRGSFVCVVFSLVPEFLGATRRHYVFMLRGLEIVEAELQKLNIPFFLLTGQPQETIPNFLDEHRAACLISDFDPLLIKRLWKKHLAQKIQIPFLEVDSHNIVPCLLASQKEEFAAYTIRPKIQKLLPGFLEEFPVLQPQENAPKDYAAPVNWSEVHNQLVIDGSVPEVTWLKPGEREARENLEVFLQAKLGRYHTDRNDPTLHGQSDLSPYFHFGHLSPQRVALEITKRFPPSPATEAYLEELIVRRELADNFCYYNTKYASADGFAAWAKKTLTEHQKDQREFTYSLEDFECAHTHDPLWNAAQSEMKVTGKMHGFMRMYWAKKILEWTDSVETAMRIAIYLNDKYELDGRDPNGYAGCAWAIGGVHDRAWFERPVYGKIRYMNYNGCKRKFDVDAYIAHINTISRESK